jgi:hypothetical protein
VTEAPSRRREAESDPAVRAEFAELTADFDGPGEWETVVAAFGEYLRQGAGLDPWSARGNAENRRIQGTAMARLIESCVESGRAGSFVRLGDGEGNVLALALGEYPALAEHCLRMTSTRHLGSPEVLSAAVDELLPAYEATLRSATVIGFPGPFGALLMMKRHRNPRPAQGLISVHRYLTRFAAELDLGAKTGALAGFHLGLLPHYGRLVSGRKVGIVTCHEQLGAALRERMGARDVDVRPVPRQAKFANDPHDDTGHWPKRYHELMQELREIEPGTLWFVAAGMVGKPYCEVIRQAGGIAVDIGHAADVWVGMGTRNYDQDEVLEAWSIV